VTGPVSPEPGLVLVVNTGSSSLKLRVLDRDDLVTAAADIAPPPGGGIADVINDFLERAPKPDAAGHRVVHGGAEFTAPVLLDAASEERLSRLQDLAPLHNRPALEAIRALQRLRPALPSVACFDTSFHASLPAAAATYALPAEWNQRWGLRRFGFHGLSHAYASRRAAELLGQPVELLRLVTAHLGAGASLAAVADGQSVDTTMGFTPLEGLVMATRSGSVDPGLVLWLQEHGGLSAKSVEHGLEHDSGLAGLAGGSGDMREVLAGVAAGDAGARLALEVYLHRLRASIAAMAAAMGGLDALVFTGGIGQASADVRSRTCEGLGFLGLGIDRRRNDEGNGDRIVSPPAAVPAVAVVEAREDIEIARLVRQLFGASFWLD
jgi:acetate kinase